MKNLPYIRWYPADAESDEKYASMSDQELGFFHRCLNKSWINNGLPSDPKELASLMKVSPNYLKRVWVKVGRCWEQQGDRLFNRRQEVERTHAQSKSDSATAAVQTRYKRTTNVGTNVGTNDLPRARASESESESDTNVRTEKPFVVPASQEKHPADNWPETRSAIDSFFVGIDPDFVLKLAFACIRKKAKVTDKEVAEAIYAKHFNGQMSAGGFMKTVPEYIAAKARGALPHNGLPKPSGSTCQKFEMPKEPKNAS